MSTPSPRSALRSRGHEDRSPDEALRLSDYLRVLRRHAVLIVLATGLGAAGAAFATSTQERVYRTSAQLIVSVAGTESDGRPISRRPVAVQAAETLGELASTPPAVSAAMAAARVPDAAQLSVTAAGDGATPFLTIVVTGPDPRLIAQVANAFAATLPAVAMDLDQINEGDRIDLETLTEAPVNAVPVSPRPKRNLLIGCVLGLVVGLAGAFARTAVDRRLGGSGDIEDATGLPVLGAIPVELEHERLPAASHPGSIRSEAYRLVRTNVGFTDMPEVPRTLLVTSAAPGEGKTSLVVNLAVSCAQAGESVVVVDADLRKPRVAYHLRVDGSRGLSDLLAAPQGTVGSRLQPAVGGLLAVLPSGRTPPNPSELLGSEAMRTVLAQLTQQFDRVIVDAPPILPVADGVKLASLVGGVILVVKVEQTTREELVAASDRLERASARVLGVVANGVQPSRDQAYGYGTHSGYGDAGATSRGRRGRRERD